jgi:hypothetical protein
VYLQTDGQAHVRIAEFINRIRGKWLKIHDSYTNTTRVGAYVIECDEDPRFKRRSDKDLVVFKVKFKVNNPNYNEKF